MSAGSTNEHSDSLNEPLAQLREAKARAVTHQLVSEAAAHAGEQQAKDRILESTEPWPTSSRWPM